MRSLFIALILSVFATFVQAEEITVNHNFVDIDSPRDYWPIELLNMAFSYDSQNTYRLAPTSESVNQERMKRMLKEGTLDIMWIGTTVETENQFRPVRVPLFKGLLGHRIFIIREGDQNRFSRINSLNDLLKMQAGQGRFWSDTPILESAGIDVVKPVKYLNLFHMLDGERFDYFPRAVHEPWSEYARDPTLKLTVETDIMLVYPMPLYFFVAKDNVELATTIQSGLRKGIDDGSFDRLFINNTAIRSALERTNVAARKVFRINNPSLSPETPLDDKSLWFDIESASGL